MAWRRPREAPHVEAPAWYRAFVAVDWDQPDPHELGMQAGHLGLPWPDELHRIHAERRWNEAKHQYRREHPALAEQEFLAIVSAERHARDQER